MSTTSPARQLRDKVLAMFQPGDDVAFATDAHSHTDVVLVAIARPNYSAVFEIDRAEYSGAALELARLMGFNPDEKPTAIDRARKARAA